MGAHVVGGRVVELRPSTEADRGLLFEVYAATRAAELAQVDWSDGDRRAFLAMQFDAQDSHYRTYYPGATFDVVVVDGEPAGRLYVDRWPAEIRVVDIALLPQYRNAGIGTLLLRRVMAEAAAGKGKVSIHVEVFNPARRLYSRLGFTAVADGIHILMEWEPGGAGRSGDDGLVAHPARVGAEGHEEQGELAQLGVVERDDLLRDVPPVAGMEDERERDAPNGTPPLLGRAVPGPLAGREHELDGLAGVGDGTEDLPGERGEGLAGESLEHGGQARPVPETRAAVMERGRRHGHHST